MKRGFTLIELMIVVAIIGILSMIALPSYQDYTKRTYVSEGLALATSVKLSAMETFAITGNWPTRNADAGLPNGDQISGQAVHSIWLSPLGITNENTQANTTISSILIFYNKKVVPNATAFPVNNPGYTGNNFLAMYPKSFGAESTGNEGSIEWMCWFTGDDLLHRWVPANCRKQMES